MWLEEAAGKVSLAQGKVQQCPQLLVTPTSFLQPSSEHPSPPGPEAGVVCSVFPLAPPTSPAPAKAKERVKGAKILHGSNLKGGGGWSCKPNAVQDLEKTLKRI